MDLKKSKSNYLIILLMYVFLLPVVTYCEDSNFPDVEVYQTPTRFIILAPDAKDCDVSLCPSVLYYEINKKTGNSLKLKGESIYHGKAMNFKGYEFTNPKNNYYYRILFQAGSSLTIMDLDKNYKLILKEEIQRIN